MGQPGEPVNLSQLNFAQILRSVTVAVERTTFL